MGEAEDDDDEEDEEEDDEEDVDAAEAAGAAAAAASAAAAGDLEKAFLTFAKHLSSENVIQFKRYQDALRKILKVKRLEDAGVVDRGTKNLKVSRRLPNPKASQSSSL